MKIIVSGLVEAGFLPLFFVVSGESSEVIGVLVVSSRFVVSVVTGASVVVSLTGGSVSLTGGSVSLTGGSVVTGGRLPSTVIFIVAVLPLNATVTVLSSAVMYPAGRMVHSETGIGIMQANIAKECLI